MTRWAFLYCAVRVCGVDGVHGQDVYEECIRLDERGLVCAAERNKRTG